MITIQFHTAEEWATIAEQVHTAVFGTERKASRDRIDFVMLAKLDHKPFGYITAKEHDSETVYWQFGGVLNKSFHVLRAYKMAIEEMKKKYKRISTCIQNTNISMLKMALFMDFRIQGVKVNGESVLVQLVKEL